MPKVLIVEDESVLRGLMVRELEKEGYEVVAAEDGFVGWQTVQKNRPDIILLDLLMPVMSGYDFLTNLRQSETLRDVPCIVLSNSGQSDDLNRAYAAGANDVLIKAEFNPDHLVVKVREQLEKSAPEELPKAA